MTPRPRVLILALAVAAPLLAADPWTAPPEAREVKSPVAASADAVAAGKTIYEKRCLNCHGAQGKGDGRGAAYMRVKPSDLGAERAQAQTDGELYWKVTNGRRPMPGFGEKLDDEARWQSVLYLRSLAPPKTEGKAEPAPAK